VDEDNWNQRKRETNIKRLVVVSESNFAIILLDQRDQIGGQRNMIVLPQNFMLWFVLPFVVTIIVFLIYRVH